MSFGRRDTSKVVALAAHRLPAQGDADPVPGEMPAVEESVPEPPMRDVEGAEEYRPETVARAVDKIWPSVRIGAKDLLSPDYSRGDRAACIGVILDAESRMSGDPLFEAERRDVITELLNRLTDLPGAGGVGGRTTVPDPTGMAKERVQPLLMERMDVSKAAELPRAEMARQVTDLVAEILAEEKLHLNLIEQRDLVTMLLNDMLGLGPLEPLLADERITDIMVNGPDQVYVERGGRLELAEVRFRDNAHVLNVAQRIVSAIGRRVDETSPLCDARLADGSRVNVIIPPLAIAPEHHHFRRHGVGQDDLAERPVAHDRPRRAHRDHRGRGRTAVATAPCCASGNPARQPGGRGRDHPARIGEELPAHAPGPHYPG